MMLHGLVSQPRHHCPTVAAPPVTRDPSGCASIFRCRWISWHHGEAPALQWDYGIQPASVAADDCMYFIAAYGGLNLGCGWLWLTIAPISVRGCSFRSGLWIPPWGPPDHRACDFPRRKRRSPQQSMFVFAMRCHSL